MSCGFEGKNGCQVENVAKVAIMYRWVLFTFVEWVFHFIFICVMYLCLQSYRKSAVVHKCVSKSGVLWRGEWESTRKHMRKRFRKVTCFTQKRCRTLTKRIVLSLTSGGRVGVIVWVKKRRMWKDYIVRRSSYLII